MQQAMVQNKLVLKTSPDGAKLNKLDLKEASAMSDIIEIEEEPDNIHSSSMPQTADKDNELRKSDINESALKTPMGSFN